MSKQPSAFSGLSRLPSSGSSPHAPSGPTAPLPLIQSGRLIGSAQSNSLPKRSGSQALPGTPRASGSVGPLLGAASDLTGAEKEQAEAYFSDLLSYSLERLSREPELLKADQEQLKRQAQESAVQHYGAFLEVAQSLSTMREEVRAIGAHLDALRDDLPSLNDACTSFTERASDFAAKRSQNKQLQRQQGALLEVLEVPSLMDTCLRNGNYDDALDLRAFVLKTSLMYPDLQLVQALAAEVEACSGRMLSALLARLRGAIQLPECLRVVGHIRRLGVFSEDDLRLRFLQCREEWLAGLVAELELNNAYDYLKRLTDVHRLQLFDVVMQFRAIFSDDSSVQERSHAPSDGGAVHAWAQHRVVFYLEALGAQLPRVREGGSLASVLEHCMYCGMSLGRVGLDFRGLLPPVFEACVLDLFATSVQGALETALTVLDSHKWVSLPAMAARNRRGASPTPDAPVMPDAEEDAGPPYVLLEHPPLAVLANGLLAALNELRHCAPLSLAPRAAAALQDVLEAFAAALAHYRDTRSLGGAEAPLLDAACRTLAGSLCPYITACFAKVYPSAGGAGVDAAKAAAILQERRE